MSLLMCVAVSLVVFPYDHIYEVDMVLHMGQNVQEEEQCAAT